MTLTLAQNTYLRTLFHRNSSDPRIQAVRAQCNELQRAQGGPLTREQARAAIESLLSPQTREDSE